MKRHADREAERERRLRDVPMIEPSRGETRQRRAGRDFRSGNRAVDRLSFLAWGSIAARRQKMVGVAHAAVEMTKIAGLIAARDAHG